MNQVEKRGGVENNKESEVARLQADRIKMDFGHSVKQALREADEAPAVADYVAGLQGKLGEATQLLQELRQSIMDGKHQTGDVNNKVQFEQLLDKVRYKVHHAFAKPEDPGRVRGQQIMLENAGENFQKRFVEPAKTMDAALKGEQSTSEMYPGEQATAYKVDSVRKNLSADKLSELQTQVSSTLERLNNLQPEIEKIAQEKALKPEEKDGVLQNYGTMYEEYRKVADELRQVVGDVENTKQ